MRTIVKILGFMALLLLLALPAMAADIPSEVTLRVRSWAGR